MSFFHEAAYIAGMGPMPDGNSASLRAEEDKQDKWDSTCAAYEREAELEERDSFLADWPQEWDTLGTLIDGMPEADRQLVRNALEMLPDVDGDLSEKDMQRPTVTAALFVLGRVLFRLRQNELANYMRSREASLNIDTRIQQMSEGR